MRASFAFGRHKTRPGQRARLIAEARAMSFRRPATVLFPRMSTTPADCDRTAASAARGGPRGRRGRFRPALEPHRAELHAHCYRMLGSVHDAEDALQDALLRAWRGLRRFEGRSSLRAWLYRIATNACLNAIERRPARVLPMAHGPPSDPHGGTSLHSRSRSGSSRTRTPVSGSAMAWRRRRRATSSARASSWPSWRRSSCSRRASARR